MSKFENLSPGERLDRLLAMGLITNKVWSAAVDQLGSPADGDPDPTKLAAFIDFVERCEAKWE